MEEKHPEILIFGCPRSGTTWIGKIFDSHPRTLYKHEPDSEDRLKTIPHYASLADFEQYQTELTNYLPRMRESNSVLVSGKFPLFHKDYLNTFQYSLYKSSVYFSKFVYNYFQRKLQILDFASQKTKKKYLTCLEICRVHLAPWSDCQGLSAG